MKRLFLFLLGLALSAPVWADDLTQALQQRLKDQGFYYGEVDGQPGAETVDAIRRYQIRHGLKVTGQPDPETLQSLRLASGQARAAQPPSQEGPYPDRDYQEGAGPWDSPESYDRRGYGTQEYRDFRPQSMAPPRVITSLPELFRGTLYERAPIELQQNVLYAIQGELVRRGLFRGAIDGNPGPATTEAIWRMQLEEGLPVSGRLDNPTLDSLQAFPGQKNGPPERGFAPWYR